MEENKAIIKRFDKYVRELFGLSKKDQIQWLRITPTIRIYPELVFNLEKTVANNRTEEVTIRIKETMNELIKDLGIDIRYIDVISYSTHVSYGSWDDFRKRPVPLLNVEYSGLKRFGC